jgi:hypothetical protein
MSLIGSVKLMTRHPGRPRPSVAFAVAFAALWLAAPASGACPNLIGDPAPGYSGSIQGIYCRYEGGPPESWTVPATVTEATFSVHGADDPAGAGGGHVEAVLPLTPGETLILEPGGGGNASVVSLNASPLFVAGGGNGSVPNYATPAASQLKSEPPGGPFALVVNGAPYASEGRISVTWGSITKDPVTCTVPRLRGMRPVAARKQLVTANCAVGRVTRRPSWRTNRGRVIGQSQKPGTTLPQNGAVDLVVGRGRSGAPAR